MLHPADGERERAAAVSEADLESRESLEDAAHHQGHHRRRRFGRHAWTKRPNYNVALQRRFCCFLWTNWQFGDWLLPNRAHNPLRAMTIWQHHWKGH